MSMADIQPEGIEVAAQRFREAVEATGCLLTRDVVARVGLSRKTVVKHRREGLLKGRYSLVYGKMVWLFKPAEVERYAKIAQATMLRSRAEGRFRGGRACARAPAKYMTVSDVMRASGRTYWMVLDAIRRGELRATRTGFKGAYLVPEAHARRWIGAQLS